VRAQAVSIPFWVFWVSRHHPRCLVQDYTLVSIPFWVFWVSRQSILANVPPVSVFQSRSGFSGCRDDRSGSASAPHRCFNPVLGFLGVATVITASIAVEDVLFQSRSGFSGCRDPSA